MEKKLREELYKIIKINDENNTNYLIAKEILQKLNRNEKLNIQAIAEKSLTTKPTVVRFAQRLGFSGFKEFNREIYFQEKTYFLNYEPKDFLQAYTAYRSLLSEYLDQLDSSKETLFKVTKEIFKSQRIILFASPETTCLANVFSERLRFLGLNAYSSEKDQNLFLLNHVQENDLVFFLLSKYDNTFLLQIWEIIQESISSATTFVIGSIPEDSQFKNSHYLINLDFNEHILDEQTKIFLIEYLLNQIFNLIIYSDKEYLSTLIAPCWKI